MNKAELIDVLTDKLGTDRRQATAAVENVVDTIVRAVHKGDSVTITGFLPSTANTAFTLEFFANTVCDPSGFGEGKVYLGSTTVTTNPTTLIANFTVEFPVSTEGKVITATATDDAGNTSEFSQAHATSVTHVMTTTTLAVNKEAADAGVKTFADLNKHADKFNRIINSIEPGSSANAKIQKMIDDNAYGLGGWKLVESSEAASPSLSGAEPIIPSPSRSHWTAAPVMNTAASSA